MFIFSSLVQFQTMYLTDCSQSYAFDLLGFFLEDHNVL